MTQILWRMYATQLNFGLTRHGQTIPLRACVMVSVSTNQELSTQFDQPMLWSGFAFLDVKKGSHLPCIYSSTVKCWQLWRRDLDILIEPEKNTVIHRPSMKKKLEQGTTLVVDRYAFSGAAFTSAKPVSPSNSAPSVSIIMWFTEGATANLACSVLFSRGSVWTGASSRTWGCQSRTSSCSCSSTQTRLLSEASLEGRDTRPVFSKKWSNRNLTTWWAIAQWIGRYEFIPRWHAK